MAKAPVAANLVPIVNRENRMRQLYHVSDRDPLAVDASGVPVIRMRDTVITKLPPGLTYVHKDVLDAAGFDPKMFRGKLVVLDPANMPDDDAIALAHRSGNREALNGWLAVEMRDDVRAAIIDRLAGKLPTVTDGE